MSSSIHERAQQLVTEKRWSEAADVYLKAYEENCADLEFLSDLGWYLSRAKRYDEAIRVYRELITLQPRNAKWHYMLGYQYYDQAMWQEAISWFEKALEFRSDYLKVLYRKGYAHIQVGDWDVAKELLSSCVRHWRKLSQEEDRQKGAKEYSNSCFQLGKILSSEGLYERAINAFNEAIKYDQQNADKYYNLGKAQFGIGRFSDALDSFLKADKLAPRKVYIKTYLGRTYVALGDFEKADKVFHQIKRRDHYTWRGIAEMFIALGNFRSAVDAMEQAIKKEQNNHNYFFLLGKAYEGNNCFEKAVQAYEEAIKLRKLNYELEFPAAQQRLAALQEFLGDLGQKPESMYKPTIKSFNSARGYGFINHDEEQDLFFHISNVENPDDVCVGAAVEYSTTQGRKGPEATNILVTSS